MTSKIPEEVLAVLSLREGWTVRRVGGTKNDNFMVSDGQRKFFLRRRHPDYCDPEWISFDHAALVHLSARGIAVCAPLRLNDRTWMEAQGRIYEVYPWVSGEPGDGRPDQDASVAAELARLHEAGRSFERDYPKGGYARGEVAPDRLLRIIEALAGTSAPTDELLDFYQQQVLRGKEELPDSLYHSLPQTLVHGDVHPDNMIFTGNRLLKFVDVDWMTRHPRIHDLAYALMLVCGGRESGRGGRDIWSLTQPFTFEMDRMRAFLLSYTGGAPLDPLEREGLVGQMRLTWAHSRLDGALKVEEHRRADFLGRELRSPFKWLDEHREVDWL